MKFFYQNKKTKELIAKAFIFLCLIFINFQVFSAVVIDKNTSNDSIVNGYIQDSFVSFTIINGTSTKPIRNMERVQLELNEKIITIQYGKYEGNKEVYIKGYDKNGAITFLSQEDMNIIHDTMINLQKLNDIEEEYLEVINTLDRVLNLLSSWSANMDLFVWYDLSGNPARSSNTMLEFPKINPFRNKIDKVTTRGTVGKTSALIIESLTFAKQFNTADWNTSGKSLCSKIGESVVSQYPVLYASGYYELTTWGILQIAQFPKMATQKKLAISSIKTDKKEIGGNSCRGRCGGTCNAGISVAGYNVPTNSNVYTQSCFVHDICADNNGGKTTAEQCNLIFAYAIPDFLSGSDCKHDLKIENYFIAKSPKATEADTNLTSKDTLYVIYDFTNAGNSKLPHSDISILFSLDGEPIGKNKISKGKKLEVNEKLKGYRKLGKLSQGNHAINLEIEAPNIIENPSSANQNNLVKHEFEVIAGYTKIANDGSELPDSAVLGTNPKDWACTKDNNTGLIWEVKTDDGGLRDKDNFYTNYDTIYPKCNDISFEVCKGNLGKLGDSTNTDGFVKTVNAQGLCGSSNWRLPTKDELLTISPAGYKSLYFDNGYDGVFWSSLPSTYGSNFGWVVIFRSGSSGDYVRDGKGYVRLVRG